MEAFDPNSISLPFSYTLTGASPPAPTSNNNNLLTTTSSSFSSCWMDGRIWSKLPQHLLDRVIALLSPPDFFRARCVCKRWYNLLFSTSFLQLYLQLSPQYQRQYWFIFFKHKSLKNYILTNNNITDDISTAEAFLFDPYHLSWYRLSLTNLIPSGFSPSSSSGGLICFVSYEAGPKSLILCNPILGALFQLPPTLRPRLFPSTGLAVGPTSIDVTIAGDDLISTYAVKNLTSESFHVDGSGFYSIWGTSSSLPRLCNFESAGRMVYVQGKFYSMNYSPFSILAHDISSNTWSKIQAPMRRFLRSPSLVESKGKLLLVAAVEKSQLNVPKSLRIWGLQSCGTTWFEMERMPQQLYIQFEEIENGNGFYCVGHGDFVVILVVGTSEKALLFDMGAKRWQWIPPCPYVNGGGGAELHGFPYEPRLATPVTGLLDQLTLPFQSYNG